MPRNLNKPENVTFINSAKHVYCYIGVLPISNAEVTYIAHAL